MKFFNSKKLFAGLAIGFGVAAITSTALAAYIITGGTKSGSVEQNQTPVEITNNIVNLKATSAASALLFQPESAVNEGRVTTTGEGNMNIVIELEAQAREKTNLNNITAVITPTWKTDKSVELAKYVVAPTNLTFDSQSNFDGGTVADSNGLKTFKATWTLSWTWGEEFGKTDPCTYFNNGGTGNSLSDDQMMTKLNEFKEATANLTKYTVALTME